MFDARTLKPTIQVDAHTVECPVLGCIVRVHRQRVSFRRDEQFRCVEHDIYISPSTYDHRDYAANLLSSDSEDLALLNRLLDQKRETERLGRERSEDAVTFNVFRAIERSGRLDSVMSDISGREVHGCVPAYWSLNSATGKVETTLADARDAFHEVKDRGTEPDLLIESADTLFLIEAKLGSKNESTPTHVRSLATYRRAADEWYARVFVSAPEIVAVQEKFYQLMRLWLLGTWMAAQVQKRFVLVSLCTATRDAQIERRFSAHLQPADDRNFVRHTWEQIRDFYRLISGADETETLVSYFNNKTLGYDAVGARRFAFRPDHRSAPHDNGEYRDEC